MGNSESSESSRESPEFHTGVPIPRVRAPGVPIQDPDIHITYLLPMSINMLLDICDSIRILVWSSAVSAVNQHEVPWLSPSAFNCLLTTNVFHHSSSMS